MSHLSALHVALPALALLFSTSDPALRDSKPPPEGVRAPGSNDPKADARLKPIGAPRHLERPSLPARLVSERRASPGIAPGLAVRLRREPDRAARAWVEGISEDILRALGVRSFGRIGTFVVVDVGLRQADALARQGAQLFGPPRLREALDVSRAITGADRADRGEGYARAHRGSGVMVAAYDSGLDLSHPDVRLPDGPSRVVALWDQDDPTGPPPPGASTGTLCDRDALLRDACPARDPTGHGTHVLAIAAGSGPRYRGLAPDAEIALARASAYERPLETLAWLERVARARGRRLVVNLSLVTQEGPHDGTSPLARAIDAYRHPVVLAAGNDGDLPVHALLRPAPDRPARVVLRFPSRPHASEGSRGAIVDLWGDGSLAVAVRWVRPDGAILAETGEAVAGAPGRTYVLSAETGRDVEVDLDAAPARDPHNERNHVRAELRASRFLEPPDGPGFLALDVVGEGRVDAWVEPGSNETVLPRFDVDNVVPGPGRVLGDSLHTLSDPATARRGLAVSAYVVRARVGELALTVPSAVGHLAPYSGRGPSLAPERTGAKPDIAAPGAFVVAARPLRAPHDALSVSRLYRAAQGTSVSAPFVTGAAALLLGADPSLDVDSVRLALLETTQAPELSARPTDPRWGAGQLDADAALGRVATTTGCGCGVLVERRFCMKGDFWLYGAALCAVLAGRRRWLERPGSAC